MASNLILDKSDAGIADAVKDWTNGGRYRVVIDIVQSSTDQKQSVFTVQKLIDETEDMEEEAPAEPALASDAEKAPKTPPVKVPY